jgi:hypothetical protein
VKSNRIPGAAYRTPSEATSLAILIIAMHALLLEALWQQSAAF